MATPQEVGQTELIDRTFLIVGLGNPGKKYEKNRHNVGFQVVDDFAKQNDFPDWQTKKDLKCEITSQPMGSSRVILIKPTTYMNESGQAVRAVMDYYKLNPEDVLVVHDELDQIFGRIRTRRGGGHAGHNGIKSVIKHCGNDFFRTRIGIANELSDKVPAEDFVLKNFSKKESDQLPEIYKLASGTIKTFIDSGLLIAETLSINED